MSSNKILTLNAVKLFQEKHSLFQKQHSKQGLMRLQLQEKTKMHKQLDIRYKEFFESIFATDLLKQPLLFGSVRKISAAIIKFMSNHESQVISLIAKTPRILVELKEPFFGSCYQENDEVSAMDVFNKMKNILSDSHADLSMVMQIHCIFVHRIYDHLKTNFFKPILVGKIFPDSLFNNECRGRKEIGNGKINPTLQLGIARHTVFAGMVASSETNHVRAIDRFAVNEESDFMKSAEKNNLPVVCGPSGHTGSLMLGARLYGYLTTDELKEYALACFAFLTAGGNHSFYEVMVVAVLGGAKLESNQYNSSISESINASESYKELCKRFPQFLDINPDLITNGVSHVKKS